MAAMIEHTLDMAWMQVRAGRDYLQQYSRQGPIDALVELIWNGLDAEADEVDIDIESSSFGTTDRAMYYVTRIAVSDNGHGITPEVARAAFPFLGDSWKRSLNGRSLNGKRALHGRLGRGRFYVYSLGHRARWSSVSQVDGVFQRIEIEGDESKIDGFSDNDPVPAHGPTNTTVSITVEQGRTLTALLRDDLHEQLAARLAPHLLGNTDIVVRVNGRKVDPVPLIDGEAIHISLESIPEEQLGGREIPVLTIVDWTDEMKRAPGIVLCNENGASLIEIEKSAPAAPVKSTGYLRWSGFSESANELLLAQLTHTAIIEEATKALERHVKQRVGAVTATIVARLKDEGSYPYPEETTDPIEQTEKEMFDLVAVTARGTLSAGTKQQRAMSAQLLKLALQERPERLDIILAQTLNLSKEDQEQLADMLLYSSLGRIVGAAAEVTRRLDLIATLRHVIYSPEVSDAMREVDQLHPLVKDNAWLFGEDWRLSRSEASLTNILRAVVHDEVVLEADLAAHGGEVLLANGKRGRVDLLLERSVLGPGEQQRLVVELKRPSVKLRDKELLQVRGYARTLSKHNGVGPSKWTFWLVGAEYADEIEDELRQDDRPWGHIVNSAAYDIWVTTWGRLLDEAERRLAFYREQLKYDISQEKAVGRVRARHEELLPRASDPAEPAA
jgi:hypothetical protein